MILNKLCKTYRLHTNGRGPTVHEVSHNNVQFEIALRIIKMEDSLFRYRNREFLTTKQGKMDEGNVKFRFYVHLAI